MGILMETTEVTLGTGRPAGFRGQVELFRAMGTPGEFYSDTHTLAINARETKFGSIVEPIPITLKTYKQFHGNAQHMNGYGFPVHHTIGSSLITTPRLPEFGPSTSVTDPTLMKEVKDTSRITRAPPKKKWIREYLEEEPKSPVSLRVVSVARSNGVVRPLSPACAPAPPAAPPAPPLAPEPQPLPLVATAPPPAQILDFAQEHSRPRTTSTNSHGPTQIPSPPSVGSSGSGSSGSAPRAGTREVHNKLEKNRRAHLKECFELLKRQLPSTPEDKKTSNLSILGSAIRYIQVLRRKERECEHEMERLAREKIAAQQRLAALKREVAVRVPARSRTLETIPDDKDMEDRVNGHVLGISIASSPPCSPPQSLNLSTKLHTLPIEITPTTSQQVVRTSYGARHNTLTLTTLAPADAVSQPNGVVENGVTNALSTLVHPAQIHLPISQVVSSGGLVVSPATLQLLSTGGGLRVVQSPVHTNGVCTGENNRIPRTENGIVSTTPASSPDGGMMVSGLTPLVVSQPTTTHLLQPHTLTHKMVDAQMIDAQMIEAQMAETQMAEAQMVEAQMIEAQMIEAQMIEAQMVKGSVAPLSLSAQYLSAAALVKPVVVVSSPHSHT